MTEPFRVRPPHLLDIVDRMARFEQHLEDALAEVDKKIADLHLAWSGAAAAAQKDAHRRWVEAVCEMRDGLVQMRENAHRAHGNYTRAVNANVSMWEQAR